MQILLADSDAELLEMMRSYLKKRGHEVEVARDGVECNCFLRRFLLPDVVVLSHDIHWGGCDGVLAELQDDEELSSIPVILVTDSVDQVDVLMYSAVVARLQKPFQLCDLLEQIELTPRILQDVKS